MRLIIPAALLLTAGCHGHVNWTDDAKANADKQVHVAMADTGGHDQLSLKLPGFDANVSLPQIDLASHVDMDGIKLAPGTNVRSIDVNGHDGAKGNRGEVRLQFVNAQSPAALTDYYRGALAQAGYGNVAAGNGQLTATRNEKHFELSLAPDGSGSRGALAIGGE